MALPAAEKTWQFNVNQPAGGTGTLLSDCRSLLFTIKNSLVGFASHPWTVVRSSAGTAGAVADSDLWVGVNNLVWNTAGSNHSWIVLAQSAVTGLQVCIDLSSSTPGSCSVIASFGAGFSGGTVTARPTATDEVVLANGAMCNTSTAFSSRVHAMMSSDGEATRLIVTTASQPHVLWMFGKAKNPIAGWVSPIIVCAKQSTSSSQLTYSNFYAAAALRGRITATANLYMSTESYGAGAIGNVQSFVGDISGEFPLTPIGLISDTAGHRDRLGQVFDLWWGPSANVNTGDTYPADDTRQFCQFGHLVFPWNGSVPVVA